MGTFFLVLGLVDLGRADLGRILKPATLKRQDSRRKLSIFGRLPSVLEVTSPPSRFSTTSWRSGSKYLSGSMAKEYNAAEKT
ncbi:hypothetical protein IMZ48_26870 [Candidatus Bathyarchaeota archaeon]|nr:hypothetical protein [Candidatus Bathyarchaeota archaeon]